MASGSEAAGFVRLQREYAFLEQNRRDFVKNSTNEITRQQKLLEQLKLENEQLSQELRVRVRQAPTSNVQRRTINKLRDEAALFTHKCGDMEAGAEKAKRQAELLKMKILKQRHDMGGVNAAKENQAMVTKQMRILENRLEKALVKFNEALAHNKTRREGIDNLRRERVVFDNIYRKLEADLLETKQRMSAVIEDSTAAYETRDRMQKQARDIEAGMRRERNAFERRMTRLSQTLGDHQTANRDEMRRLRKESLRRQANSTVGLIHGEGGDGAGGEASGAGSEPSSPGRRGAGGGDTLEKRVAILKDGFASIQEATGIADVDELIADFREKEDRNYSQFNFVQEQQNEIEQIEEALADLKAEERTYSGQGGEGGGAASPTGSGGAAQHKQLQRDLSVKVQHTSAGADKFERRSLEAAKILTAILTGINTLFDKIGCRAMPECSDVLADGNVNESTLMQYLGMIEQRTNELLQLWSYYKKQSRAQLGGLRGSPSGRGLSVGPSAPALRDGPHHIKILPPSMDEYEDDDDALDEEGMGMMGGSVALMPHKLDQIKTEVSTYMDRKRIQAEEEEASEALLHERLTGAGKGDGESPSKSKRRIF